jgi:c-di-GMP-binding flagellar brake protein YcgR
MSLWRTAGRKPAPPAEPEGGLSHGSAAPQAVASLLQRVQQTHSRLAVRIGDSADTFSSVILEVSPNGRYVVLDELIPREGEARLRANPRVHVRVRLDAVELHFTSRVAASASANGAPYHKVPFPSCVEHSQKRRYFRALVPLQKRIPVIVQTEQRRELHGELRDISAGGFSAHLWYGPLEALNHGDYVPRCLIALPADEKVCVGAEICYLSSPPSNRSRRLGARFIGLNPSDERRIERLVSALDREVSRKQIKSA